jgi:diphosphomevalonate decarboxylase
MSVTAKAQPNIALIKYWGKRDRDRNLPAVSSLSVTLDSLWTTMSVAFDDVATDTLQVNGAEAPAMLGRVSQCLDQVIGHDRPRAVVVSESNFPIGAGLASSASAFAALVVAVDHAAGTGHDTPTLARLAGAISGSAARSLYGGIVDLTAGNDDIEVRQLADFGDWPLEVIVAVTEQGEKAVGSGEAMIRGAQTSPFYSRWIEQQDADMQVARQAVGSRDFGQLGDIAEHNCLKMHSVMWSSRPPIVYWNKATLECMQRIRQLRIEGHDAFFTIDAGPQVKAVCLPGSAEAVDAALARAPGVIYTMRSKLGPGARIIDE